LADPEYQPEQFYYTDAINDHAVRFVSEHVKNNAENNDPNNATPFFLYMAHTAAHWPMHAKEADIAKYKGRYDSGYGPIRAARLAQLRQLGLLDERWEPTPQVGDWRTVDDKAWESRCMEVYAAMLDCMDQGIGRLLDTLKQTGQYENTVILFLQDNGGCAEGMGRADPTPDFVDKPTLPPLADDYLQPDMIPKQTRDGFPVRRGKGVMPGGPDTYIGYGRNWANVSNTPFREYKHWQHEGGISTPLIAHWPSGIGGELHNQLDATPTHLIDIMATCVELAEASYPSEYRGNAILPPEGVSLLAAFQGTAIEREQPIFWEHEGNRAIRSGKWKLVSKFPGDWELYDIETDRTEMHDLAEEHPARLKRMSEQWEAWAARVGVRPWPLVQ
jgi:arylsulfatase A-like enzyme